MDTYTATDVAASLFTIRSEKTGNGPMLLLLPKGMTQAQATTIVDAAIVAAPIEVDMEDNHDFLSAWREILQEKGITLLGGDTVKGGYMLHGLPTIPWDRDTYTRPTYIVNDGEVNNGLNGFSYNLDDDTRSPDIRFVIKADQDQPHSDAYIVSAQFKHGTGDAPDLSRPAGEWSDCTTEVREEIFSILDGAMACLGSPKEFMWTRTNDLPEWAKATARQHPPAYYVNEGMDFVFSGALKATNKVRFAAEIRTGQVLVAQILGANSTWSDLNPEAGREIGRSIFKRTGVDSRFVGSPTDILPEWADRKPAYVVAERWEHVLNVPPIFGKVTLRFAAYPPDERSGQAAVYDAIQILNDDGWTDLDSKSAEFVMASLIQSKVLTRPETFDGVVRTDELPAWAKAVEVQADRPRQRG